MSIELCDSRTSQEGVRPVLHFPMCSCHRDGIWIDPFDEHIRYPVFRTIVTRFLDELFEAGKGKGRWEEDGWDITVGHRAWVLMLKREGKVVYIERGDFLFVLMKNFCPGSWEIGSTQYAIGHEVEEKLQGSFSWYPRGMETTGRDRIQAVLQHVGIV